MVFLRYPFSFVVVSVAFVLTAGVFLFLRPEYHDATPGKTIDLSGYPGPAHGWTWKDGTPGFVVRTGTEDWNVSRVRPRELPRGARLLTAEREQSGLSLFAARGRCVGAQLPQSVMWFCPPRLGPQHAFLIVDAIAPLARTQTYAINLIGVTRADVRRIVVANPGVTHVVHPDNSETTTYGETRTTFRIDGNWGAFGDSLASGYRPGAIPRRPWRVRLDVYGARGLLASKRVSFARSGVHLVVVP